MRNVTIALASFIVGATSMFLFGNHASTLAQAPNEGGQNSKLFSNDAAPVVPPFRGMIISDSKIEDVYNVDGFLCRGCEFRGRGTILVYGGGEFKFENVIFDAPPSVKLTGAAANAAVFLNSFGLLGCPANNAPHSPPQNNAPILRAKFTPVGDFQIIAK